MVRRGLDGARLDDQATLLVLAAFLGSCEYMPHRLIASCRKADGSGPAGRPVGCLHHRGGPDSACGRDSCCGGGRDGGWQGRLPLGRRGGFATVRVLLEQLCTEVT